MIQPGDIIKWKTVNRDVSGKVVSEQEKGNWLVALGNGSFVIVNEKSMKKI